jgi:spore germination protein YaaH
MKFIYLRYTRTLQPFFASSIVFVIFFSAFFYSASSVFAQTSAQVPGVSPHALLYVTNSKAAIQSLRAHINSMDIIAPQIYAAKADGTLLGEPSTEVIKIAHNAGAEIMPLIINQDFSQSGMHSFLMNTIAQDKLVTALIAEAKEKGYIGFQYDFEHMQAGDKDLYSIFVAKSAPQFHAAGLQISVAMAPRHSDNIDDYGVGSWDNWTGAFDYHAIGAVVDFVSVMAYDDSRSVGPVASIPFVQSVLDYSLARIPAEKISLGVPTYAWIWRDKTGTIDHIRGYPAVAEVLKSKSYVKKGWSDELGVSFVTYFRGNKKFTAWYEDQKSFQRKIALVTDNKLYGFSAWALGLEDPKVWDVMLAMRAPRYGLALNSQ